MVSERIYRLDRQKLCWCSPCAAILLMAALSLVVVPGCEGRPATSAPLGAATVTQTTRPYDSQRRDASGRGVLVAAFAGLRNPLFSFRQVRSEVRTSRPLVSMPIGGGQGRHFLRMSGDDGDTQEAKKLREEYDSLLKGSGRSTGMKKLKPQKGSLQASSFAPLKPQPASPGQAAPWASEEPAQTMADLLDPPKPSMSPKPAAPRPPVGPSAPLVKPSYASGPSQDEVMLVGVCKGDTVPPGSFWDALTDYDGSRVTLASSAGRKLLLVPEPAHHTAAVTDSWTRILNDLRDVLGSKRSDVSILAVSPETPEVHAKMRKRENYKFSVASDPDRIFLSALKLWNPSSSGRASIPRQSFLINPDTGKVLHVWRNVQAAVHAVQVRDYLDSLANEEAPQAQPASLAAPPPRPVVSDPEPEAPVVEEKAPTMIAPPPRPVRGVEGGGGKVKVTPVAVDEAVLSPAAEKTLPDIAQPPLRSFTMDTVETRMLDARESEGREEHVIDASLVGSLIGRGGTRVRELSKLSGAFIKFQPDPPRMVLGGTDQQRKMAFDIAQAWMAEIREEVMPLEMDKHGIVIGPKGKTIKSIEAATGAMLRFEKEPVPGMVVKGTEEERVASIAMAQEVLAASSMVEEVVELDPEMDVGSIRVMIRNNGTLTREMEEATGARIRFEVQDKKLMVKGTKSQRDSAKAAVAAKLAEVSETESFEVPECEHYRLIGPQGKVVKQLEEESGARISFVGDPGARMMAKGTVEQRAKAWELANAMLMLDASDSYPLAVDDARLVIGPGGATVKIVEGETGARVTITRDDEPKIIIRGNSKARAQAWAKVQALLTSPECKREIELDGKVVELLLSGRASLLNKVEIQSGVCLSVERVGGGREGDVAYIEGGKVRVIAHGMAEKLDEVEAILLEAVGEAEQAAEVDKEAVAANSKVVPLRLMVPEGKHPPSILDVRRLVGSKGGAVKKMEQETGASILFSFVPEPTVTLIGTDEAVNKAMEMIKMEISNTRHSEERFPVEQRFHGTLIGVGGRTVQKMEEESGARITFQSSPESVMIIRGTPEQREKAYDLALKMLEDDSTEIFFIEGQQFKVIIGTRGHNVRDIERKSGARVQVPSSDEPDEIAKFGVVLDESQRESGNRTAVVLKGTSAQRERAKELVMELVRGGEAATFDLNEEQHGSFLWHGSSIVVAVEEQSGAKIRVERGDRPRMVIRGTQEQRETAWEMVAKAAEEEGEDRHSFETKHPLLTVRLLIGPQGSKVKELERVSGARIKFSTEGGNNMMIVRGTKVQRQLAWEMVQAEQALHAEDRFPLSEAKHYIVIGVGGEQVKSIEAQSGAAIGFEKKPVPAMVVKGTREQREMAIQLAKEIIRDKGELEQQKFPVDRKFHALLIGSTGKRVQELEKKTGAHIQFESQPEEVMLVTGTVEQRQQAYEMVLELISAEEQERVPVPASLHRTLIGVRGISINLIEKESGAHIGFETQPEECMVVRGTKKQRELAIELANDVLAGEENEQFYVEHRYHGYLIGPGGSRVREIEQQTVTRVSCNDEEPVVVVTGTTKRRDAAWELIKSKMDEYDADRSASQ